MPTTDNHLFAVALVAVPTLESMMAHRVLILGGTTEARELAARLGARNDLTVTLSLAGRTANPVEQPVPVRIGGFGGAEGLARYLRDESIELLIDATHPFAARISANAAAAAKLADVALLTLRRPEWRAVEGDIWTSVDTIPQAVAALGDAPRKVFVTLGRQELKPLEAAPQHFYAIRSVDPVEPRLAVPHAQYILDRGPFEESRERALLERLGIEAILSKNSGGAAAYAKLAAARALKIPVVLVRRPPISGEAVESVEAAEAAVAHLLPPVG
jgi:precorrin-6A/cobalt-precorrin-6A reductase